MKNLKSILSIVTFFVILSSCKKTEFPPAEPACTTVCQNGGIVKQDCGCDCPVGFTGTNCQTRVNTLERVNVSVNRDNYHLLAPIKYAGDNDYNGRVSIDGTVKLELESNGREIYAVVNATYIEEYAQIRGDTKAKVDGQLKSNRILLYTAPAGKKVYEFNDRTIGKVFSWYPSQNQLGAELLDVSNSFVYKIQLIGDTTGDDLPFDGSTERSRLKIWFDDFKVTIGNL